MAQMLDGTGFDLRAYDGGREIKRGRPPGEWRSRRWTSAAFVRFARAGESVTRTSTMA